MKAAVLLFALGLLLVSARAFVYDDGVSESSDVEHQPLEKPYRTARPPYVYRGGQKRLKKIGEACKKNKECETFNCVYKKVWPGKGGTTKMCLRWNEHQ